LARLAARLRVLGVALGLCLGTGLVAIGLAGTWRTGDQTLSRTVEISPGIATDGHVTIRLSPPVVTPIAPDGG
jgi:hypothetical protein